MDSIKLAEELIRFKSISPSSEGSLEYLEQLLKNAQSTLTYESVKDIVIYGGQL